MHPSFEKNGSSFRRFVSRFFVKDHEIKRERETEEMRSRTGT
jgi:hypothetical protein